MATQYKYEFTSKMANSASYNAAMQGVGSIANSFPTPRSDLNENSHLSAGIREGASDAMLASGNPYVMAAGAAVKVLDKTGGFSDSSDLDPTTDTLNTMASILLPGAGWLTPPTESYKMSAATQAMSDSYSSTAKQNQKAAKNAGAHIIFGRRKAQDLISRAKQSDAIISDMKENADQDYEAMASMTQSKAMANQQAYSGGYSQALARAGKQGMKLQRARIVAKTHISKHKDGGNLEEVFTPTTAEQDADFFASLTFDEPEVQAFKEGGQMNVIPEGALHARLHHMENADELTKKGIPVIDNQGNQQAEIECNEIIFNLDVTKKLEELRDKYNETKDEKYAIEIGKLLSKEIMENTNDRTGLIDKVE